MSKMAVSRKHFKQFNIGDFLSAKIYSDLKSNFCSCGGQFIGKETWKGLELPCCDSDHCDNNPSLFRINARISDENGAKRTITIRHSQDGERLTDPIEVITTLKRIKQEINEGNFDCRKYDSATSKDSFLFENVLFKYFAYYDKRLKLKGKDGISPGALRKKKTLAKLHLKPYFTGIDVNSISSVKIKIFKDSWTDRLPTRNHSLAELKRILNWCCEYELIKSVPKFDPIPKTKQRNNVASIATVREVLPFVEDEYYLKIFKLLGIYPIRPCEVRCLRWKDINIRKKTITIQRHLSDGVELDGRKSIDIDNENGKGKISYPLTDEAINIIKSLQRSIDKNNLLFPSKRDIFKFISHSVLPFHWSKACKAAKVTYFEPYEIKHARASEISENNNGNVKITMDALGHTNINTTMRYIKSDSSFTEIFQ